MPNRPHQAEAKRAADWINKHTLLPVEEVSRKHQAEEGGLWSVYDDSFLCPLEYYSDKEIIDFAKKLGYQPTEEVKG